jgi:hypothetical protein
MCFSLSFCGDLCFFCQCIYNTVLTPVILFFFAFVLHFTYLPWMVLHVFHCVQTCSLPLVTVFLWSCSSAVASSSLKNSACAAPSGWLSLLYKMHGSLPCLDSAFNVMSFVLRMRDINYLNCWCIYCNNPLSKTHCNFYRIFLLMLSYTWYLGTYQKPHVCFIMSAHLNRAVPKIPDQY